MATENQGIMSLPQWGQEAAPQLSLDDSYDAVSGALSDASPEMSAQVQQLMAQIVPQLDQLTDEQLDSMLQLIQYLHDHPEEYKQKLQELISNGTLDQGMLPEEYDPELLAVLGMVLLEARRQRKMGNEREAQMPAMQPPATMARGGIAEAARMVASKGRTGDSMLAHITPKEAKMLRKKGGMGTVNPATGLPEYGFWTSMRDTFTAPVKSVFNAVKAAVQPILSTTVGRILATAALAAFIGPGAFGLTGALGIGAQMGLAAAGVSALSGGNLKDVLRAGATSFLSGALAPAVGGAAGNALGVTNQAAQTALGAGITGAGIGALSGQPLKEAVKSGLTQGIIAGGISLANTPTAEVPGQGDVPVTDLSKPDSTLTPQEVRQQIAQGGGQQPDRLGDFIQENERLRALADTPARQAAGPTRVPTVGQSLSDIGGGIKSIAQGDFAQGWEGVKGGIGDLLAPNKLTPDQLAQTDTFKSARAAGASYGEAIKAASDAYNPSLIRQYGPAVGAGLGVAALTGGFTPKPVSSPIDTTSFGNLQQARDLIAKNPTRYTMQGIQGVKYDDAGNVIGSQPWTSGRTMADVRAPMIGAAYAGDQGSNFYTPPANTIGGGQGPIYQPYNTADMYTNLIQPPVYAFGNPMRRAEGGMVDEPVHMFLGGAAKLVEMIRDSIGPLVNRPQDPQVSAPPAQVAPVAPPTTVVPPAVMAPPRTLPDVQAPMMPPTASPAPQPAMTPDMQQLLARMYPSLYNDEYRQQLMGNMAGSSGRGLASLAEGGYPRRTGQISGPGTETSDSIPAMLSDGEFVMTAKAVRGAGKGSRRAGAKKMYALMHQLERNASRG